jgi:hypothetical protein
MARAAHHPAGPEQNGKSTCTSQLVTACILSELFLTSDPTAVAGVEETSTTSTLSAVWSLRIPGVNRVAQTGPSKLSCHSTSPMSNDLSPRCRGCAKRTKFRFGGQTVTKATTESASRKAKAAAECRTWATSFYDVSARDCARTGTVCCSLSRLSNVNILFDCDSRPTSSAGALHGR